MPAGRHASGADPAAELFWVGGGWALGIENNRGSGPHRGPETQQGRDPESGVAALELLRAGQSVSCLRPSDSSWVFSSSSSAAWISGFSLTGYRNPRTWRSGEAPPSWLIRFGTGVPA